MREVLTVLFLSSIAFAQQGEIWSNALPTAWGPLTDGWQLSLSTPKQSYRSTEPIWVRLVARNESSVALRVAYHANAWAAAQLKTAQFNIIKNGDTSLAPLRQPRDKFQRVEWSAGSAILKLVQPGHMLHLRQVDLRVLFDLSAATYTLTVAIQLPSPESTKTNVLVSSNPITVSVLGK